MTTQRGFVDLSRGVKPLGYCIDGKLFVLGEPGPVSIERFNEVVGGDLGNGLTLTFEIDEDV
jgi:hypothetical protein